MAAGLRLDIELRSDGWAMVRLTAPGVQLEFPASYTPVDSIGDLARATAGLAAGLTEQLVAWNTEPEEFEFQFTTTGDDARLEVRKFPDHRRRAHHADDPVAVVEEERITMIRALWRGLRRLQGSVTDEGYATAWKHPFPADAVERIAQHLRVLD
jgi:hypothetical protein